MSDPIIPIYDIEEIHYNCTVYIWRNSVTGDISIGWTEQESKDESTENYVGDN